MEMYEKFTFDWILDDETKNYTFVSSNPGLR